MKVFASATKKALLATAVLLAFASIVVWQRHYLLFKVMGAGEPPPLLEESAERAMWRKL